MGDDQMHQIKEIGIKQENFKIPGEKIRALRKNLGYNQREFAFKVNMSASALNRIESGQSIQPRRIVAISDVLGIHPRELDFSSQAEKVTLSDNISLIKKMFPNWKEIAKEFIKEVK